MELIKRTVDISGHVVPGKVLVVYGPRQVGKTTIITSYLAEFTGRAAVYSGDSITIQEIFSSQRLERIREYVDGYDLLYIDEAQNIRNIGMNLKLLIDAYPALRIVVTGSSSFELAGQVGEPLMGRHTVLNLYPITDAEVRNSVYFDPTTHLDSMLRFGSYPEVVLQGTVATKITKLKSLADSFLLKDIFKFESLKKPDILVNLVRSLAYQIGTEVNVHKLSKELGVNGKTIERYITLLEQSFVLFRLKSYSTNARSEIRKRSKIYFYDLGIRNALINDFSETNIKTNGLVRRDTGALFENFFIVERMKRNAYTHQYFQTYFWRAVQAGEVDYIETRDGTVHAYECTIGPESKKSLPRALAATVTVAFTVVTPHNYYELIA